MKTVILDENIPQPFRFDVFITGDQNLRYQQNLVHRKISIIEVQVTRLDLLRDRRDLVINAVLCATPGSYQQIN